MSELKKMYKTIMDDHFRLQRSPATFEQQRGQYPVRREFPSYTIRLSNARPEVAVLLQQLGFIVNPV